MKLQRYRVGVYGIVYDDDDGDYVKYSDVQRLIAERQSLQKDAERYKWLRNNASYCDTLPTAWCVYGGSGVDNHPCDSSELDDAVDEAIKKYLED